MLSDEPHLPEAEHPSPWGYVILAVIVVGACALVFRESFLTIAVLVPLFAGLGLLWFVYHFLLRRLWRMWHIARIRDRRFLREATQRMQEPR
jgi:uncharacterized RDD family membrane protein YckC